MTLKEEMEQLRKEIELLQKQSEDSAKQIENLRQQLEEKPNLTDLTELDDSLISRHKSLKD